MYATGNWIREEILQCNRNLPLNMHSKNYFVKSSLYTLLPTLGPPEPPEIKNNETELSGRNVTVTWKGGADNNCLITMYTLYYREEAPHTSSWQAINISDATSYNLQFQYSKCYHIIVSARNQLGETQSKVWILKTAQGDWKVPSRCSKKNASCYVADGSDW